MRDNYLAVVCLLLVPSWIVPLVYPLELADLTDPEVDALEYLQTYCYMGDCSPDTSTQSMTAADMRSDKMIMVIKRFQNMALLPMTGKLDEPTRKMMKEDRCGFPDYTSASQISKRKKRYTRLGTTKWQGKELSFSIRKIPTDLPRDQVIRAIESAFIAWSTYIPLNFTRIDTSRQFAADIDIEFSRRDHRDGYNFDGPGGTLAHAFSPGLSWGGDIHFDEEERWGIILPGQSRNTRSITDVFTVAVHEIGHSLGLGHSNVAGAIMRPFYNPQISEPGKDDVMGVQNIYGARQGRIPPLPPPIPTTPRPRATTPRPRPVTPRPPVRTTTPPAPRPTPELIPFYCVYDCGGIDAAVTDRRRRTFFFRCGLVYLIESSNVGNGYPKVQSDIFPQMTAKVDAAERISRNNRENIYLFSGSYVFTYDAMTLFPERSLFKRRIRDVFSGVPDNLDAIFRWSFNGALHFVKGDTYYVYSERSQAVTERGSISRFGVRTLTAAFQWPNNGRNCSRQIVTLK